MARVTNTIEKVGDHFRVFAAMGMTLAEAKQACPFRLRMPKRRLESELRTEGIIFPEMTDSKTATRYKIRRRRSTTIREAIRNKNVAVSPQAVRYRVNKMGWPLEQALSTPLMSRAESGRLGSGRLGQRGAHVQPNGQLTFKFLRS